MNITIPTAGDIGEKRKWIEVEPLEVPSTVPAEPQRVEQPEPQHV